MLNDVHSSYGNEVYVLMVGVNAASDWEDVDNFAAITKYTGIPLLATKETLQTYGILSQSTKIALDGEGEIVFRKGYGGMAQSDWAELLNELTAS